MTLKTSQVQPQTPEVEIKTLWIAIVYSPQNESVYPSAAASLLSAPVPQRQKCNPIHISLPFEKESLPGERLLGGSITRSIFIQPGTSLGIVGKDWNSAQLTDGFKKFVKPKIDSGVIRIFVPQDDSEPVGYRCFDEQVALKLVASTLHEDWVDSWMIGEERKNVKIVAEQQKAELIRIKEAMKGS